MNEQRNQNITESDLIQGCLNGERRMQEELYRRFAPKMYTVCLRYAGKAEEAEDILQEGFIKIFRKLSTFRGDGSFEGWLRRVFVNTSIEHFRKKNYLQPVTEKEESTIEGKYLSVLDSLATKDIMKLIQELSPGYKTVFNLYVVEGYTHKEIGEMLMISEGTSKWHLNAARQKLKEYIENSVLTRI